MLLLHVMTFIKTLIWNSWGLNEPMPWRSVLWLLNSHIMNLELFDFRFRTWNFELFISSFQLRISSFFKYEFRYVFTCISFKTCHHQLVQTRLKSTNLWSRNIFFFVPRSVFDCVTLIQMTAVAIIFEKNLDLWFCSSIVSSTCTFESLTFWFPER